MQSLYITDLYKPVEWEGYDGGVTLLEISVCEIDLLIDVRGRNLKDKHV